MKNGKVTLKDELKLNPLDPEIVERIQEELTDERNRQEDLRIAALAKKKEADPQLLMARIEHLEKQVQQLIKLSGIFTDQIGRMITIAENNK